MMEETDQQLAELKQELLSIAQHKENVPVRRSPRLKTKSPVLSPVNLRVSTLKKNLHKKVLFENNNSPLSEKAKKAEKMYNNLRQLHPLLQTPKFKASGEDTPRRKNLSAVLKKQCLMLQETPVVHKVDKV